MAANNIIFYGESILNLSETTAVESDVAQGKVFYKANGMKAVGTYSGGQPSSDSWYAVGDFNDWTAEDSSYELIETDLEYIANNIDATIASNLSNYNFENVYYTHIQLGVEKSGLLSPFSYDGNLYQCYTSIIFQLVKGQWTESIPNNYIPTMIDTSNGTEGVVVYQEDGSIPTLITVNGAGNYYVVLAENSGNNSYLLSIKKYESIQSDYGNLIPYDGSIFSIGLIGSMTDWQNEIAFTKIDDTHWQLSNYSFNYDSNLGLPIFCIRANQDWGSLASVLATFQGVDFSNISDYFTFPTSAAPENNNITTLRGCTVNIDITLAEDDITAISTATATFTWLADIAKPPFEIISLDLVGTQNNWEFGQTPFILDSGSASGQGTWILSNNSFTENDTFVFVVNERWEIVGGRDWNNFTFVGFPDDNDYNSYLALEQDDFGTYWTKVLQSFTGTITISVDAEQVELDRNLSSAIITITYQGV